MWLVRLGFFLAGAFVGCQCILVACLECGLCIRTFHPNVLWASGAASVVAAWYVRAELARGVPVPGESHVPEAALLASGGWFPFVLQSCIAAIV